MSRSTRLSYPKDSGSPTLVKQLFVLLLTVMLGILISVTVNAQAFKKRTGSIRQRGTASGNQYPMQSGQPPKIRKDTNSKASANQYVNPTLHGHRVVKFEEPSRRQLTIIQEMVAQHLREEKHATQFQITTLQLLSGKSAWLIEDMTPFLIAIEFALQGRTVEIQAPDSQIPPISQPQAEQIRHAMEERGVPGERIKLGSFTTAEANERQLVIGLTFKII